MNNKSNLHYFDTNKELWNAKVPFHIESNFYDVPGFLAGKTSLNATEITEVGDVKGKSLLHLQCHFGQDTLSWARAGAEVTGVDFSSAAILAAKKLQQQTGLAANFIESNVFDIAQHLPQDVQFDIIFTSYGTICWLDDLNAWAGLIARYLKPGGFFYIVDFHPSHMMFNFSTMKIEYDYFKTPTPYYELSEGTYAQPDAPIKKDEYFWNHAMSETITALINSGLQIDFLHEFNFSHYNCFTNMVAAGEREWLVQGYEKMLPLMYSIKATKR